MSRWLVIAAVVGLGLLAIWRSLTLYSNVAVEPVMDPTELRLVQQILGQALAADSAGAVSAGAAPAVAGWALRAARRDSMMVRGWTRATETTNRAVRGDTIVRAWFTTASMQRCSGAAELTARFVHDHGRLRLTDLQSPCLPPAPITFEVEQDTAR